MPKYRVTVYTRPMTFEINAENVEVARRMVEHTVYVNAVKEVNHVSVKVSEQDNSSDIARWIGVEFDSSSGLTEQFAQFAKEFKSYVRKVIEPDYYIAEYSRGHFEVSMFIRHKETDRILYISISDVRHFRDAWWNDVLIRTAKDTRDYAGGSNCSTKLNEIKAAADRLVRYEI